MFPPTDICKFPAAKWRLLTKSISRGFTLWIILITYCIRTKKDELKFSRTLQCRGDLEVQDFCFALKFATWKPSPKFCILRRKSSTYNHCAASARSTSLRRFFQLLPIWLSPGAAGWCRLNPLTYAIFPYANLILRHESSCTGWSKNGTKFMTPYFFTPVVIESCGFQQNVPKEILYVTKVSIWIQQLNILCYCRWQLNYAKHYYPTPRSIKNVPLLSFQ